ncbi:MAG: hypothetical protein ACJ76I_09545 [Gaiellaceae bacterium]
MLRKTAAALLIFGLVGCGSRAASPPDREWTANARGVEHQLREDIVAVSALDRPRAARRALHDDSQLYGLLVSYTDFGGCRHMVAALGAVPERYRAAQSLLERACRDLRTADALFMRAVSREDPTLLVRATSAAVRALSSLDRAQLALRVR